MNKEDVMKFKSHMALYGLSNRYERSDVPTAFYAEWPDHAAACFHFTHANGNEYDIIFPQMVVQVEEKNGNFVVVIVYDIKFPANETDWELRKQYTSWYYAAEHVRKIMVQLQEVYRELGEEIRNGRVHSRIREKVGFDVRPNGSLRYNPDAPCPDQFESF